MPQAKLGLVDDTIDEPKLEAVKDLEITDKMIFAQKINSFNMYICVNTRTNCMGITFSDFTGSHGYRLITNRECGIVSSLTYDVRRILNKITNGAVNMNSVLLVYDTDANRQILNQ